MERIVVSNSKNYYSLNIHNSNILVIEIVNDGKMINIYINHDQGRYEKYSKFIIYKLINSMRKRIEMGYFDNSHYYCELKFIDDVNSTFSHFEIDENFDENVEYELEWNDSHKLLISPILHRTFVESSPNQFTLHDSVNGYLDFKVIVDDDDIFVLNKTPKLARNDVYEKEDEDIYNFIYETYRETSSLFSSKINDIDNSTIYRMNNYSGEFIEIVKSFLRNYKHSLDVYNYIE